MNQTNIHGTPGQVRVISIDPNNVRISLDNQTVTGPVVKAGTYNQVTVDSSGKVVSGSFVPVATTPLPITYSQGNFDARAGDYGGGAPNWTPTSGQIGLAIDAGPLGGNRMWWYFNSSWN